MSQSIHQPPDVAEVKQFAKSETLLHTKMASIGPSSPLSPIAICVVKNEFPRLPEFLSHHRKIGIEGFVFIDNGSTDGGREFLLAQADVDLFDCGSNFHWKRKHGWITQAIERKGGADQWWLLLDADEHTIFARCEVRAIQTLVNALEERGATRARGALVDMYGEGSLASVTHDEETSFASCYPYFDAATYHEHRTPTLTARTGGPRQRLLASLDPTFAPALTKYPLFRLRANEIAFNPHQIWPPFDHEHDPCLIALKHFKFDSMLSRKAAKAVAENNYWNSSYEYRKYLEAIEKNPDFTLIFQGSRRYVSSQDFLNHRIISHISSSGHPARLQDKIDVAIRQQRAERLSA